MAAGVGKGELLGRGQRRSVLERQRIVIAAAHSGTSGRGSARYRLRSISIHISPPAAYLMELRSTRKPRLMPRPSGEFPLRSAERQCLALSFQLPPRNTRDEPDVAPVGSVAEPLGYAAYQSWHHSQTLPYMSYSPLAFGFFSPTGCVFEPELLPNQP